MGFLTDKTGMPDAEQINETTLGSLRPNVIAQAAQPGRRRLSTLDILGGITDALAEAGGMNAGYREGIERRENRQMQQQEQEWRQKFNQQKLEAGQNELDTGRFERFGTAAKGLGYVMQRAGPEGVRKAFPMLAQQMGMDPDEQQIFAASLETDPQGTLGIFEAINANPEKVGSQAKEIAIYEMLNKQGRPDLAEAYLEKMATGDGGMTEYQKAQIGLGRDKLTSAERIARIRAARAARAGGATPAQSAKQQAAETARVEAAQAAKGVLVEMRDAYNRLRDAGGINARGQGIGGRAAAAAFENVPMLERMSNPEGFSARQDLERLRTTGISSLLPLLGSLNLGSRNIDAAKELETWRKAIASASDYESAMRALDGIERRIEEITAMPQRRAASSGTPRPKIRIKPKNTPKPGTRLRYNPATGDFE